MGLESCADLQAWIGEDVWQNAVDDTRNALHEVEVQLVGLPNDPGEASEKVDEEFDGCASDVGEDSDWL